MEVNDGLVFAVLFVFLLTFVGGMTTVRHRRR
jgi:hypothetical protein